MTKSTQTDLFLAPSFDVKTPLLPVDGMQLTILIGCSRSKKQCSAPAGELYISERFQKAKAIASRLKAKFYVVSAKHGLIERNKTLSPYDVSLGQMSAGSRALWGEKIATELQKIKGQICILTTKEYSEPIIRQMNNRLQSRPCLAPLSSVEERFHNDWYEQAYAFSLRVEALRNLYKLIELRRQEGKVFLLSDLSVQDLPRRGVYLFLDRDETNFYSNAPRIVRVGTHAVSKGSKALLKSRLRNHLGLKNGSGNHRGSIFRLHIGRAMLERESASDTLPSWGQGQDASRGVKALETSHEIRVSNYLSKLEVFVLDVDDEPSKDSLRAAVETQLIALCSENLMPVDYQGNQWLGRSSPVQSIERSGLWNIRDVGKAYFPKGRGSVEELLSRENLHGYANS